MPVRDNDGNSECVICMSNRPAAGEGHEYANDLFYELPCGHGGPGDHALHVHCLVHMDGTACPLCRADFSAVHDDIVGESLR